MRRRILVIDDEELLVKTFARLLARINYDVSVAVRPVDAIEMAQKEDFDLVLCDIRMPGKNGVETIQEIRSFQKNKGKKESPVIFLTGFADPRLEGEAQMLHPIAYLYKPFDTTKLLDAIELALNPLIT